MRGERQHGRKDGRRKGKEFMDAALDAYIRYLALQKWREITDRQEREGIEGIQAVQSLGHFSERGVYQDIWQRWWQNEVVPKIPSAPSLLGCIELAIRGALTEEIAARKQRGDVAVEDTVGYKAFLDYALESLFAEEAGIIEEI